MKTKNVLAATALVIPLLTACSQGQPEAQPVSSPPVASNSTSPVAQTTENTPPTAAAGSDAASAAPSDTATPASSASGGTQLPAVADPCAGTCTASKPVAVQHPTLGAMEIVAYARDLQTGAAPSESEPSYALYQNDKPVGYVVANGAKVVSFGTAPQLPGQTWELGTGSIVDRHGNVFLSYEDGVTVLTPTDKGYDSQGTMPAAEQGKAPFENSGLKINGQGQATIVKKVFGKDNRETGQTENYVWDGSTFTPKS